MLKDKNGSPLKRGTKVTFAYADMFEPQRIFFDDLIADKTVPVRGEITGLFEGDRHDGEDKDGNRIGRCAHEDNVGELVEHLPGHIQVEVTLKDKTQVDFPMDPALVEAKSKGR